MYRWPLKTGTMQVISGCMISPYRCFAASQSLFIFIPRDTTTNAWKRQVGDGGLCLGSPFAYNPSSGATDGSEDGEENILPARCADTGRAGGGSLALADVARRLPPGGASGLRDRTGGNERGGVGLRPEMRFTGAGITVTMNTYAGLFLVALATLMYEILLTRIFSVTMWYHFAFMAVSVAMFGLTVGAIIVYQLPQYFAPGRTTYHLALSSLAFAVSIVISFLTHLSIPFVHGASLVGLYSMALTYIVIALPFVFSGICVCLALTRFPERVSRLYAADLVGAALGCVLLVYTLRVTDGPTAVFIVAALASIGAVFFARDNEHPRLMRVAMMCGICLTSFAVVHTILVNEQFPLLRLLWVKGRPESRALYEKWNSFSRIRISGDPSKLEAPFGWGLSPEYPADERKVRQLYLTIDAGAGTVLTAFEGDVGPLGYLKYDVVNLAHYLRPRSKVLVVGVGGGRDILSALVFGQGSIVGVEMNEEIVGAINKRFADFTGHLDKYPHVTFITDEARSYLARLTEHFDIIQVSLIDTWAATAAGAFVLAEHSLYTVEAWKLFLDRLTPNGVLTVSRWYRQPIPGEMYRLTSLASASLTQLGVRNPRDRIVIVRRMNKESSDAPYGVGTILVSKEPFSDQDLQTITRIVGKMQFELVLSPEVSLDSTFATIASGKELDRFWARFPINIAPPTDDSPFFFNMHRLRGMFDRKALIKDSRRLNVDPVFVLGALLVIVVVLTSICIVGPLMLTAEKAALAGTTPLFVFFAAIGLGFMLVEISQMQRLVIFLGHPTHGLSVVLFALLLSSGLGSYLTQRIRNPGRKGAALICLALLLCALVGFGMISARALTIFQGSITPIRVLVGIALVAPLGLFMGMAFPLGIKIASERLALLTPWLWGINGATSVCAPVLAVSIALSSGISTAFWTGVCCYAIAFVAYLRAVRTTRW